MRDMNVDHSSNVPIAFSAALASGASRPCPSDRRCSLLLQRRLARWRLAGLIVAALLNLATPTASTAQDTATGTVVVPGPEPTGTGPAALPASPRSIVDRVQIDLGYTYDDNVTRGRTADEILADQLLGLNASAGGTLRVNDNTRVVVTGMLNGEKFKTYNGLSNLSGGLQAELQYRQSAAFDAVTFGVFARGWLDNYESHLRDGSHFALGVNAQGRCDRSHRRLRRTRVEPAQRPERRVGPALLFRAPEPRLFAGPQRHGVSQRRIPARQYSVRRPPHAREREAGAGLRAGRRVSRQTTLSPIATTRVHGSAPSATTCRWASEHRSTSRGDARRGRRPTGRTSTCRVRCATSTISTPCFYSRSSRRFKP